MDSEKEKLKPAEVSQSSPTSVYRDFLSREKPFWRAAYQPEQEFYATIASGDLALVKRLCQKPFTEKSGLGILSGNPLQNLKYHFAITAAMVARACISHGMELSEAYNLSDFFIRKADAARDKKALDQIHREMCLEYTAHMQQLQRSPALSRMVVRTLDYIDEHLHTSLGLSDLAALSNVSPEHLSRTFHKEMHCTINTYICNRRLDTAIQMLLYTDDSIAEISSLLAFSSQSYFSRVFSRREKLTPSEYRRLHLRNFPL